MHNYYQSYMQLLNMFSGAIASVEMGDKAFVLSTDPQPSNPFDMGLNDNIKFYICGDNRKLRRSILSDHATEVNENIGRFFRITSRHVFTFKYFDYSGELSVDDYDPATNDGTFDGYITVDKRFSHDNAVVMVNEFVAYWNMFVTGDVYMTAVYENGEYIDGMSGIATFDEVKEYAVNGFETLITALSYGEHRILDETTGEILEHYSL